MKGQTTERGCVGCNCVVPICSLFPRSLFSFHRLSFPSTPLTYGIDWKFHTGKCRCPLSGLGAHEGLGQSAAGSPRSVFPPSLTATPVLLSTLASNARSTCAKGACRLVYRSSKQLIPCERIGLYAKAREVFAHRFQHFVLQR